MSKIRLIGAELSKINMCPGDRLYIRCTFQALEDMPVDYEVKLFADFKFGHMLIDKKEQTYFRSVSDMYPQPAYWRKGEIWSSSVIWNIPNGLWAGSYAVSIGMIDNDTVPVEFAVGNKVCNICRIGNVNVVFDGFAKEYMKKHSGGEHFSYESENIPFKEYDHSFDAVISVRNRKNDEEIKRFCVLKPNEKYSDDYVSLIIKKNKESYYVDYIEEKFQREFFLKTLPIGLLCNELMEDYSYKDGIHTMTYSNDSSIVYDEANDKIEVKHNGRYLTKDGLTLAKGYKDNEYFGYCERGDYAVNNIFKGKIEGIFDLSGNAVEYTADDNITIKVKNGIPFKIVLKID